MKKFIAVSLFFGLAAMSQAAVIVASCTGTGITFASQTETCTTNLPGGAVVSGVTVAYSLDLIHLDNNAPSSATFSFDGPGTYDFSGTIDDNNRPVSSFQIVAAPDLALFSGASFTVVDTFSQAVNVQAYNVGKTITITYDVPPPSGVPEPSTFVMLGTALTGLGVYARRKKA